MLNKQLTYCLIVIASLCVSLTVCAEDKATGKEKAKSEKKDTIFRGVSAHIDIASPLMGYVTDHGIRTLEGCIDVNLLHRFFPIVEVGYGQADKAMDNGSHYTVNAPFTRIGLNLNLLNQRQNEDRTKGVKSYAFLGVRYGMSFVNYSVDNVRIIDEYWQLEKTLSYHKDFAYAGWAEIVGGIRVDLVKGFTMGWSIRYKMLLHSNISNKNEMWYVPGYGKSDGSVFDFNYTIGYTFRTNNTK
ncbi:MAG: hypothetical protein EOM76_04820 [Sphingobacteriia bacterium]|nr:hypothetical protein [Sphingobacteriia bacterium]